MHPDMQKIPLHRLLATLFSEEMSVSEKTKVLKEEYDIDTKQIEEGMHHMCNLSDRIEERGIERGIEKGIELSVRNLMDSLGWSLEKACEALKIPLEEYEKISK